MMTFVFTKQEGFRAARKNGVKIVFDNPPDKEQAGFAERLADGYAAAFPRICEYLFAQEEFRASFIPDPEALRLSFIRFFSDGTTELWYDYYLPFEGHRVSFAIDVGFTGCFEEFTGIFIDY